MPRSRSRVRTTGAGWPKRLSRPALTMAVAAPGHRARSVSCDWRLPWCAALSTRSGDGGKCLARASRLDARRRRRRAARCETSPQPQLEHHRVVVADCADAPSRAAAGATRARRTAAVTGLAAPHRPRASQRRRPCARASPARSSGSRGHRHPFPDATRPERARATARHRRCGRRRRGSERRLSSRRTPERPQRRRDHPRADVEAAARGRAAGIDEQRRPSGKAHEQWHRPAPRPGR